MKKEKRKEYLKSLEKIFKKVFNNERLTLKENTTTKSIKKWDSLNHIKLILACEKFYKIKFNINDINKIDSVNKIINLLIKMK